MNTTKNTNFKITYKEGGGKVFIPANSLESLKEKTLLRLNLEKADYIVGVF